MKMPDMRINKRIDIWSESISCKQGVSFSLINGTKVLAKSQRKEVLLVINSAHINYLNKNMRQNYMRHTDLIKVIEVPWLNLGVLRQVGDSRYEGLNIEERLSQVCDMHVVQGEKHVLFECTLYTPTRYSLFQKMIKHNVNFNLLSMSDKMICMFTSNECVKFLAKFCYDILNQRRVVFFNV